VSIPFLTEAEAVDYANDSEFGLQAGVFTNDINRAMRVADVLETGGVRIYESSLIRYDHIPYGTVKQSGIGKEGVKYAIEDMTELKSILASEIVDYEELGTKSIKKLTIKDFPVIVLNDC
jgi:acyl-CoA reductase-like NAD-dependent aldehyde dehydrogenase